MGVDLSKHPKLRSEYQRLMGAQNVQAKLDNLAKSAKVQQSLENMRNDVRDPERQGSEPQSYYVNQEIQKIMQDASEKAWRQMLDNPQVQKLILEQKTLKAARRAQESGQRAEYESLRTQLNDLRNMQPK